MSAKVKNFAVLIALAVFAYGYYQNQGVPTFDAPTGSGTNNNLQSAYASQLSDVQVNGQGAVVKVLRDDTDGSRHQLFILRVGQGHTILVSHNIDLAPRVKNLQDGDTVQFFGEYEWNSKGGVVHWTHHDPAGRHVDGWLKHQGNTYQ